jgi:large repetitive protein
VLGGCAGLAGLDDYDEADRVVVISGGTGGTSGQGGQGGSTTGTGGMGAGPSSGGSGGAGGGMIDCAQWHGSFTSRYHCEVMADSPASYWRLGEADSTSTYIDLGSNGANGTQSGSLSLVPALIDDATNGATRFDGGYINVFDQYDHANGASYTIELWMRAVTVQPTVNMRLLEKVGQGNVTDVGWRVYVDSGDGDLMSARLTDGPDAYSNSNVTASDSGATYLVVTYDTANLRVFVDGVLLDTASHPETLPDKMANLYIGTANPMQGHFDGIIDELAIYAEVLSDGRMDTHFEAGTGLLR